MSDEQVDAVIVLLVLCIAGISFTLGTAFGGDSVRSNTIQSCNNFGKARFGDTVIKCEVLVE